AYAYSGFRDRPIQPLSHLSAGENTRIVAPFPPRKSLASLDFAAPREYPCRSFPSTGRIPCPDRSSPLGTVLRLSRRASKRPRDRSMPRGGPHELVATIHRPLFPAPPLPRGPRR